MYKYRADPNCRVIRSICVCFFVFVLLFVGTDRSINTKVQLKWCDDATSQIVIIYILLKHAVKVSARSFRFSECLRVKWAHTYWKCNWKHLIIIVGARTRHVFNVFNAIVDFQRNYNKWNLVFLKRIRQAASKICSFPYLHCGLLSATALIQRYLGHTRCWDICYPTIYPRHTNLTNVVR